MSPTRLLRILNQMVAGNSIWEVPSADYGVQFNEQMNREVSVPLVYAETLVSMGYARRVEHDASEHRLDCWVPTDIGRELSLSRHRKPRLSASQPTGEASAKA